MVNVVLVVYVIMAYADDQAEAREAEREGKKDR